MKKVISILLILVIISCKGEKASINNDNNYYGEMFKIFGYPATLIIINNK